MNPTPLDLLLLNAKEPVEARRCQLCGAAYTEERWLKQHKTSWHKQNRETRAPGGVASHDFSTTQAAKDSITG